MEAEEDSGTHLKLISKLDAAGVSYRLVDHAPAATSQEAAKIRGSALEQGAKALVFRTKGSFLLYVTSAATNVDTKALRQVLKLKSLSFATEDEVWTLARLRKGAVPPFGSVLGPGIPTYADESLTSISEIVFNCGLRTRSAFMARDDWLRLEAPTMVRASTPGGGE